MQPAAAPLALCTTLFLVLHTVRDAETLSAIRRNEWRRLKERDIKTMIYGLETTFPHGDCPYLTCITQTSQFLSADNLRLVSRIVGSRACNVRELTLRRVALSLLNIAELKHALRLNTTLRRLDLADNELGPRHIRRMAAALSHSTTLRYLDLSRNAIGLDGITVLAKKLTQPSRSKGRHGALAPPLAWLNLRETSLGSKSMPWLAKLIANKPTLRWINVGCNGIGANGVTLLVRTLSESSIALTHLGLDLNDLGVEGARELARFLRNNRTLTHLYIPRNNVGDEGAAALADALCVNRTLRYLQLEFNDISSVGAQALSAMLRENNVLQGLQLDLNLLGDDGCAALADALAVNTSLEHLSLRNNRITDIGAGFLAKALARNCSLQHLALRQNRLLGIQGHSTLADALSAHSITLKSIQLDYGFPEWEPIYETYADY
ncbi:hypothetical protein THASP1DRAFT_25294 [Thamnocephalis sphaerospora]|uniref:RNI-like protein n=1 Tax=Thamnocephalis sphaerospora TaxID=78915 RepID=A0A4P9XKN5_9FUNG|nr:hypothetical protein THASP1DRAFT_25294 [Thamnocephalis sphaerospora]|eukprot:RKP06373.1 hypothetical protein THASP1DRAFT_25294 [Thamnocephalis sphaerospora]